MIASAFADLGFDVDIGPLPAWLRSFQDAYSPNVFVALLVRALLAPAAAKQIETDGKPIGYLTLLKNFVASLVPLMLVSGTLWLVYWYIIIHQQVGAEGRRSGPATAWRAGAGTIRVWRGARPKTSTSGTASRSPSERSISFATIGI